MSVLHAELKSHEIVESCDAKDVKREDESFAKLSFGKFDEIETPKEQKVLGLNWNTENDILTLKFGKIVACVQTLLIPFQTGSPPVESAHQRPNPCCEFMRNMKPFLIG